MPPHKENIMETVSVNKTELETAIRKGDWPGGRYYLAVADGQARIYGCEDTALWHPWPTHAALAAIPALDPEGSGQAQDDARVLLSAQGKLAKARAWADAHDELLVSYCERFLLADWEANRQQEVSWLADTFLDALNGEPSDLPEADEVWGVANDGTPQAPPATFQWEKTI
jgi:hypothetical protein